MKFYIFRQGVAGPANIFMERVPNWAKLGTRPAMGTKLSALLNAKLSNFLMFKCIHTYNGKSNLPEK
jgi:hypothetical protein